METDRRNRLKEIAQTALDESLAEHDEKHHPSGYQAGQECNMRKTMEGEDVSDKIGDSQSREATSVSNGRIEYLRKLKDWMRRASLSALRTFLNKIDGDSRYMNEMKLLDAEINRRSIADYESYAGGEWM